MTTSEKPAVLDSTVGRIDRRTVLTAIVALIVTLVVQWWIATAGTGSLDLRDREFRYSTGYYGQLAAAFAAGRVDLLVDPPAAFARLPDLFDPDQRYGSGGLFDASYYAGRYYLYFGPVPALPLLAISRFVDVRDVSDSVLAVVALAGITTAGAVALTALRQRIAPTSPRILLGAGIVVFGLANPLPFMLSRPAIYEAAILWGQLGIVGGVACAAVAGSRRGWWLAAGACWAIGIGSRLSLLSAVVPLLLALAVWSARDRRTIGSRLVLMALPLGVGLSLYGWYNQARFGSVLEVGHRYQLTGYLLQRDYDRFTGIEYVVPNSFFLGVRPPDLTSGFPFVTRTVFGDVPPFVSVPPLHQLDPPIAGLVWTTPVVLLILAAPLAWHQAARLPLIGFAVAGAAAILPALIQRYTVMRYQADAVPLLVLASVVTTIALTATRWHRVAVPLFLLSAVMSVGMSVLYSLSGDVGFFRRQNPSAFKLLVDGCATDWREREADVWPRLLAPVGDLGSIDSYAIAPTAAGPGDELTLRLRWTLRRQPSPAAQLHVRVLAADFRPVLDQRVPLAGCGWAERGAGRLEEVRLLRLPADLRSPDYLRVELAVEENGAPLPIGDRTAVDIGPVRVQRRTGDWRSFTPVELRFTNLAILRGVRVGSVESGSLPLTLFWEAGWSGVLDQGVDRTVIVELIDDTGRVVSSTEGEPGDGWYPIVEWWPGERFVDERDLPVPPTARGTFQVRVRFRQAGEETRPDGESIIATIRLP